MSGTFQGRIKSFNDNTGYGFIECDQTMKMYGKDMFVSKVALPGGTANKGDQVTFDVTEDSSGWRATDVKFDSKSHDTRGGYREPHAAILPSVGWNTGEWGGGGAGRGGIAGNYVGIVKSYNQVKGWGMITCDATNRQYGKDMFFMKRDVPGGNVIAGHTVRFSVVMDYNGPVAKDIQFLGAQYSNASIPMPMQSPMPHFGMGPYMSMGMGPMMTSSPFRFQKMPPIDQTFYGVIRSFNEEKGWGHISCDAAARAYGKDVFLLRTQLNGQTVQPGALVSFKVTMGHKGPHACAISLLPSGSFGVDGAGGAAFSGVVKSFSAERGWGFISGDDIHATFGKDIFLPKRELGGHVPTLGEEVKFHVEIDKDGQPVATGVSMNSYQGMRVGSASSGAKGGGGKASRARPY